jgi:CHAD domain-containing protein
MAQHHHDIIPDYIAAQLASVEKHLTGFSKDCDAEHLHQLRVSIKKLRAIIIFTESDRERKQYENLLKPLFQDAGAVRIFEICLSMEIMQSCAGPELMNHLKNNMKEVGSSFFRSIQQYELNLKNFRQNIDHKLAFPDAIEIAGFVLREKIKAIEKFDTHQREDLHKFRQIIKDIKYVFDIIPSKIQRRISLNKSLIDKLQKEIGEWHDTYSTLNLLWKQTFAGSEKCIQQLEHVEHHQFESVFNNYPNPNL